MNDEWFAMMMCVRRSANVLAVATRRKRATTFIVCRESEKMLRAAGGRRGGGNVIRVLGKFFGCGWSFPTVCQARSPTTHQMITVRLFVFVVVSSENLALCRMNKQMSNKWNTGERWRTASSSSCVGEIDWLLIDPLKPRSLITRRLLVRRIIVLYIRACSNRTRGRTLRFGEIVTKEVD